MTQENYRDIVLNGYSDNPKFLAQYYIRECKKAESLNISQVEFFERLYEIIDFFENRIKDRYLQKHNTLSMIVALKEEKGEDAKAVIEIKDKLRMGDFNINLSELSLSGYIDAEARDNFLFLSTLGSCCERACQVFSNFPIFNSIIFNLIIFFVTINKRCVL